MEKLQTRGLSLFWQIAQDITSNQELSAALGSIAEKVRAALEVENISILLLNETTRYLEPIASVGSGSERIRQTSFSVEEGVAGWVAREGVSVRLTDAGQDSRHSDFDRLIGLTTRSLLAVPLLFRGQLIGVMEAFNKRTGNFDTADQLLLEAVAGPTAMLIIYTRHARELEEKSTAIEEREARLRELNQAFLAQARQLERLATTDYLTGLYNYRSFHQRLGREMQRAHRYRRSLSVLIMDLDGFRSVNETYGYQAGDFVLARLASLLVTQVRNDDVVARYGGEEFAFILPETGEEGAVILAERLRSKVAEAEFPWGNSSIRLTVSLGIGGYEGADQPDSQELIRRMNLALQAAKRAGGNCVRVYSPEMDAEKPVSSQEEIL